MKYRSPLIFRLSKAEANNLIKFIDNSRPVDSNKIKEKVKRDFIQNLKDAGTFEVFTKGERVLF